MSSVALLSEDGGGDDVENQRETMADADVDADETLGNRQTHIEKSAVGKNRTHLVLFFFAFLVRISHEYVSSRQQQQQTSHGISFIPRISDLSFAFHTAPYEPITSKFNDSILQAYSVLNKKVAIRTKNYTYALTELSPLNGLCIYGAITLIRMLTTKASKESFQVPAWKAAVIGFLFSLYNLMFNLGNRGSSVPGGIVMLISKLIVPFSAIMSRFPPMRIEQSAHECMGLFVLLVGAAITLVPKYDNASSDGDIAWCILLLISAQPVLAAALLFVEFQISRIHPKLDIVYLWSLVCFFESLAGLPLAPLNALVVGLSMSDIPRNLWDGFRCVFAGIDTDLAKDDCGSVPFIYALQIIANCCFNMSMAAAVRNSGGATLMWFVRAVTLPFGACLFAWPLIMGTDAEKMTPFDAVGVILVTFALFVYQGEGISCHKRKESDDDKKIEAKSDISGRS